LRAGQIGKNLTERIVLSPNIKEGRDRKPKLGFHQSEMGEGNKKRRNGAICVFHEGETCLLASGHGLGANLRDVLVHTQVENNLILSWSRGQAVSNDLWTKQI